jgi:hypothetical protein
MVIPRWSSGDHDAKSIIGKHRYHADWRASFEAHSAHAAWKTESALAAALAVGRSLIIIFRLISAGSRKVTPCDVDENRSGWKGRRAEPVVTCGYQQMAWKRDGNIRGERAASTENTAKIFALLSNKRMTRISTVIGR